METINKAVPTGLCETAESETVNAETELGTKSKQLSSLLITLFTFLENHPLLPSLLNGSVSVSVSDYKHTTYKSCRCTRVLLTESLPELQHYSYSVLCSYLHLGQHDLHEGCETRRNGVEGWWQCLPLCQQLLTRQWGNWPSRMKINMMNSGIHTKMAYLTRDCFTAHSKQPAFTWSKKINWARLEGVTGKVKLLGKVETVMCLHWLPRY